MLGHGPGCRPLVELVNHRGLKCLVQLSAWLIDLITATSIMRHVKAFVQVVGPQRMPTSPKDLDPRTWYHKVSIWTSHFLNLIGKPP